MREINELIEQIGRERLEFLSKAENLPELQKLAQFALAVLDAKQSPVWGQARFKGGEWSSCSAEHAAMVMTNPEEWDDYECRYLYTTPPAASVQNGWVKCSDRMPKALTGVLVAAPWDSAPGGYAMKWATNCIGHPDADGEGWIIPGASWKPTHWIPLPAAPAPDQ